MILWANNNLAPSVIHIRDESGNHNEVANPEKLANLFNEFFQEKVKKLRQKTDGIPAIPPVSRLQT